MDYVRSKDYHGKDDSLYISVEYALSLSHEYDVDVEAVHSIFVEDEEGLSTTVTEDLAEVMFECLEFFGHIPDTAVWDITEEFGPGVYNEYREYMEDLKADAADYKRKHYLEEGW